MGCRQGAASSCPVTEGDDGFDDEVRREPEDTFDVILRCPLVVGP